MKIINNSIRYEIKDIVIYKNKLYDIIKIHEDCVWLSGLKKHVNIFDIKPAKFLNLKTGRTEFMYLWNE
jgi:hypothetical protein